MPAPKMQPASASAAAPPTTASARAATPADGKNVVVTYNIGATSDTFMLGEKTKELFQDKLRKDLKILLDPEVS
jgi:hypothetical protein